MRNFINLLKQHDELVQIDDELSCDLQIAHIAYLEAKKPHPKVLLFSKPTYEGKLLNTSVVMNLFANEKVLLLALGCSADNVASKITKLLNTHIPSTLGAKLQLASELLSLKNIAPKRKINPKAPCKEREYKLSELPVLRTWSKDAGRFITMGQVYTKSLDGKHNNLGMYRLQLAKDSDGDDGLIMHFQLHKDANNFYYEYKKAGKNMPIAIAIGGHPLNILCAQAPLPRGIFEPLLAGFITGSGTQMVRCETNELYVPADSDFVIEGEINMSEPLALEGPFGDHTGFYTPQGYFPIMKIRKITGKKDAIFSATVVGKPPLEDRWMGYATERIFAPLLRQSVPQVIDYRLPENGCFHNLCLVKIRAEYPGAAQAVAHAFWGLGQMAFCKNIIVVDEAAPALKESAALAEYIVQNLDLNRLHISSGICDELDHSSRQIGIGGKLLIDACKEANYQSNTIRNTLKIQTPECKHDMVQADLAALVNCLGAKDYLVFYQASKMPIICLFLDSKQMSLAEYAKLAEPYLGAIVVLFDDAMSMSAYMLLFRALANFDAAKDIYIGKCGVLIDACKKGQIDGYENPWPDETMCDYEVIKSLIQRKIIKPDLALFKQYEVLTDMQINQLKEINSGDL